MVKINLSDIDISDKLSDMWAPLNNEQREFLANNFTLQNYKKNEVIYCEGETPTHLMCLLSGKVKIFKEGVGGRSQIIRMIKPTEYFAYRAFFAKEDFVTAAAAFEPSLIGLIPMSAIMTLVTQNNDLAMFFIRQLSIDLGIADERTVNLTQKHIRGRLAESLIFLKESYGLEEDGSTLSIYLSREDLANLSNMTTSNAIRTLSNFATERLITIDGRKIKIIDEDNVTDEELMAIIKGPDFPTEGIILGREGIKQAYTTGRGKITVRAEAEIEEMSGNKQRIVVTSLPYQVNKAKLIENIANLAREKRIEGISDLRDESDRQDKVRVVIELKRDANAQVVLNQLYKFTQMQDTFGIIMLALVDGEPKILTLKQCLEHYINHRKTIILRRTQFELDKALARAHILEGLKIALDNIDEIINIIRSSYDDAKERLMKRFKLSDIQAQAILDMRLKTLSGLQREKIEEEYNELMKLIEHLRAILGSEKLVFDIIKEELTTIKEKYGDERKTKIVSAEGEFDIEDLIKEEQTVVALTHFGYIKRMPADTYKSQKRGGKGITGISTREEDFVKQIFTASTHDTILFFSNKGKLYKLKGYEIPEGGRTAKGTAIVNLLRLDNGEKISAVIPISNFADGKYLLMATKNGLIKKTALTEYNSAKKTGLLAITLKEDDELIDVRLTDGEDNVVLVTKKGLSITFDEKDVRPVGRSAQGVIGIRLDNDDDVIGMESIISGSKATLLAITENGFGKRTELDEYRVQNRGGRGVITYKVTPKTGNIVGIRIANGNEDVMLITDKGTIIRLKVEEISVLGRATQGVTLMRTNDGGKVVSIEIINQENE